MSGSAFDDRVDVYEALIDWPKRLAHEEPFYRALFERVGVRSVLDTACGTGQHAAMFHSWGCRVEGADVSPAMIARCKARYGESETLHWVVRAFDQPVSSPEPFDAAICVGNSLALAAELAEVERAVREVLAAVRPDGVCVLQVLNLWHLPDGPCVWQKCKRAVLDGRDHVIVKGVHRVGTRGFVDLVDLTLGDGTATSRCDSPTFLGLEAGHLTDVARRFGARQVDCFGGFPSEPYIREQSQDLIVVIRI